MDLVTYTKAISKIVTDCVQHYGIQYKNLNDIDDFQGKPDEPD